MTTKARNVSVVAGVATMESGEVVDLTSIQAKLNEAFAETGDHQYMLASDKLSKITGLEQTAAGFMPSGQSLQS